MERARETERKKKKKKEIAFGNLVVKNLIRKMYWFSFGVSYCSFRKSEPLASM